MNVFIHALSPLIVLANAGSGGDTLPKGSPPTEKSSASQFFEDVQVLVNGKDVTNGVFTVRKDAKRMCVTVTMKMDKKFGPLDSVGAQAKKYDHARTKRYEGLAWLITATSESRKPAVNTDGSLTATLDLPIPVRMGDNHLRIRAYGEKHEKPVYVAEVVIRVVEAE